MKSNKAGKREEERRNLQRERKNREIQREGEAESKGEGGGHSELS